MSLSTTHPFDNVTQEFSSIITVMRVKGGKIWDAGKWYARWNCNNMWGDGKKVVEQGWWFGNFKYL